MWNVKNNFVTFNAFFWAVMSLCMAAPGAAINLAVMSFRCTSHEWASWHTDPDVSHTYSLKTGSESQPERERDEMKEFKDFTVFNSLDIPVTVSPAAAGGDRAQGRFHGSTAASVPLKVRPEGFTPQFAQNTAEKTNKRLRKSGGAHRERFALCCCVSTFSTTTSLQ